MRLSFDRGTLLIDEPAAAARPGSLPGVLWDPRVRRFRAPAWRYRDLQAALRNRGVPFEDGFRGRYLYGPEKAAVRLVVITEALWQKLPKRTNMMLVLIK